MFGFLTVNEIAVAVLFLTFIWMLFRGIPVAYVPATFTGGVDMTGVGWRAGQVINLDLAEHDPGLTGTWEIVEKPIDLRRGRYGLSLKRYDAAAEDYDAQTEELPYEEAA